MALERLTPDPATALVRLARPERRNALDTATLGELVVAPGLAGLGLLGGLGRAKERLLTGRVLDAAAAAELGLLHRVAASAAEAEEVALALAVEIAAQPPAGARQVKRLLREFEHTG